MKISYEVIVTDGNRIGRNGVHGCTMRVCNQPVNHKDVHRHNWTTSSLVNDPSDDNNNVIISSSNFKQIDIGNSK